MALKDTEPLKNALQDGCSERRSRQKGLGQKREGQGVVVNDKLQCRGCCRKGRMERQRKENQEGVDVDVAAEDIIEKYIQQIYSSQHTRKHTFLHLHLFCKHREDGSTLLKGQRKEQRTKKIT